MKKIRFLSLLFFMISTSFLLAQSDKSNYALLWEITGNDLEKPSYLLGSYHVRAKMAFEFPDSLLYKLEACDAFANEIHLDSAMFRVFQAYHEQDSTFYNYIEEKKNRKENLEDIDLEKIKLENIGTPNTKTK